MTRCPSSSPNPQSWGTKYLFYCPGCESDHTIDVRNDGGRPNWTFDGDLANPTFNPSLLYPDKNPRCHLFVKHGMIEFLGDCGHRLAGLTVTMFDAETGEAEERKTCP